MARVLPADDHRTRVAAQRRERTRRTLLESAMLVFAERGPDASVIDEVIHTAGVSRGTFYNYFRSDDALLAAVAEEVGNQIVAIVDPVVRDLPDPGARVASGVRLVLAIARAHPRLAAFLARVGPPAVGAQSRATASLTRDLADGIGSGRFADVDARLAVDLVIGPVLAGFHTIVTRRVPAGYVDAMARSVLQALGVPRATARRLATLPLDVPSPPADSLLVRAEARAAQVRRGS
jgi:AcrR family transcriptional regulator